MYCDFVTQSLGDGTYRHECQRSGCGIVAVTAAPRHRRICNVQPEVANENSPVTKSDPSRRPIRPSHFRRITSFATSVSRWVAAGRPIRSEQRVAEIFTQHCRPCQHFKPGRSDAEGKCGLCGCRLRSEAGVMNKIKMATEGCPKTPPAWEPEVEGSKAILTNGVAV
jgi:hypothetical protein